MEDKITFKKYKSQRNKDLLIVNEKYIFNHIYTNKINKIETYKCNEYKSILRCPAFLKIKDGKIEKYSNKHNHETNDMKAIKEITKNELKLKIQSINDPFSIKLPKLYKSYSVDKGIKIPAFNSIKSTLYKEINKNLPNDIKNLEDAPSNSIYYSTCDDEEFFIFKNNDLLFFQSTSLAKIQIKFGDILFCDGTFYSCPSIAYQLFITRVYSEKSNAYYITSFSLMYNKTEDLYTIIFQKLHDNINKYLDLDENYEINELHTDFEIAIGNSCKKFFPDCNIKYCIWHYNRALENNMNTKCKIDINNNDDLFILYNYIRNLYICEPEYIPLVFKKIEIEAKTINNINFLIL